jgi:hypothetical protein
MEWETYIGRGVSDTSSKRHRLGEIFVSNNSHFSIFVQGDLSEETSSTKSQWQEQVW